MKSRKDFEYAVIYDNRNSSYEVFDTSAWNLGLVIEILLDIRDLLMGPSKEEKADEK